MCVYCILCVPENVNVMSLVMTAAPRLLILGSVEAILVPQCTQ
jgi:hypothetical protein